MELDYSYPFVDPILESYFARMNLSTTGRFSHPSNEQQRSLNTILRSDDQYSPDAGHPTYQNSSQIGTKYMEKYPYLSNFRNNNGGCGYDHSVRDQDYHNRFALQYSFPSTSQNGTGNTVYPSFSNIGNNNGGRCYNQNIQDQDSRDRYALRSFPNIRNNYGSTSRPRIRSQSYDALDQYGLRGRILDTDSTVLGTGSRFRRLRSLESANSDTPLVSSLPSTPVLQSSHPSLEKLKGRVAVAATSQNLYRVLHGVLDERKPDLIEMIFLEVKDYVDELMENQFGNHVIQKPF
ncbi:hypothetical protein OIU84_025224 [Salix udensis]|uniref:PUM-HD domain-containing protein n=1 Tax=Salix udensis TaxID=889485 RepID=A0AAD6KJ18_9ROSI|nr:hypothetical protein OIU84_025224 [Salix udensis]